MLVRNKYFEEGAVLSKPWYLWLLDWVHGQCMVEKVSENPVFLVGESTADGES